MTSTIRNIEITFPVPVELPCEEAKSLVELASILCKRFERNHPGRVMWPCGIGDKPTFIPLTPGEERARGL